MWILEHEDVGCGKECSDSLASLTRRLVSSVGRASDLQAEGRGFESYTTSLLQ